MEWPGQPVSSQQSTAWPGQPVNQERSLGEELGRQLGLTGRAIAGGLSQAVQPLTEPVRYLLDKAGVPGQKYSTEQNIDALLTKSGVPEPETDTERGVQTAGRFVTSLAGGYKGGGILDDAVKGKVGGPTPSPQQPAPSSDDLRQYAQALYKQADESGVVLNPQSFGNAVARINARAQSAGIDPTLHPKATAALKRLSEATDGPIAIKDVETLRKVVNGAAKSTDPDEARVAIIIKNTLDDYVLSLKNNDVITGDGSTVGQTLREARGLWSRMSKSELLEDAIENASIKAQGNYSGAGFETAIRQQFSAIARNKNKMRRFSPEEQAAIKKVATGGPVDNALRYLGKLAPRGLVSGILGPGAVTSVAGPEVAGGMLVVGEAARRGATAGTTRNVQNAVEMMRRGAPQANQGMPSFIPPWMFAGVLGLDEGAYGDYP